ncbi:type 1 glutamine amidotransferase [Rhizosaccharibacter radicis]|uniref:Type 1 glutamine amidotransferase n=1 Tax=Rhizosaccharibacter radicis TaxID=2782605 RepID=A0ABT1W0M6_9PROT|nr:type 1 glutamine amidotransferase [Acetobacteraceae bacterium KSS12]
MLFLVADSETAEQREKRRETAGCSSAESFASTLRTLAPGSGCEMVRPHEEGASAETRRSLDGYDGVFLSGSPLHVYEGGPGVRRQLSFMRSVFAAGVPCFGSCAGLQIAVAAVGGRVGSSPRHEVGLARRITATARGADHPLLAGRPASWDALSVHSDVVEQLPEGAVLLAGNSACPVQAVEIRHGGGLFWGVQYHPELSFSEIGAAIRRQSEALVDRKLARTRSDVDRQAELFDAVEAEPERPDLAWRLGIDEEVTDPGRRRRELVNFLAMLRDRAG